MFAKVFKQRASKSLIFGAIAFFLLSTASAMLFAYGDQGMQDLPGCPLMSHDIGHSMNYESGMTGVGQILCPMSLDAHFAKLGVMMSTMLEILSVLALLLVLAWFAAHASAFLITRLLGPPLTNVSNFAFAFAHILPKNLRLQEAFSQGILHSKAY